MSTFKPKTDSQPRQNFEIGAPIDFRQYAASLKAFAKKLRELAASDLDDSGISIYDFKKTLIK